MVLLRLGMRARASQREISAARGLGLGKIQNLPFALLDKDVVKARDFCRSGFSREYADTITTTGIRKRIRLTRNVPPREAATIEALQPAINALRYYWQNPIWRRRRSKSIAEALGLRLQHAAQVRIPTLLAQRHTH